VKSSSMKVGNASRLAAAATLFGFAVSLAAQDNSDASADAKPCELHIWAADDFDSLPFGAGLAPGLAAMFPGNLGETTDEQFTKLVSGDLQFEAIKRADPVASLGLPESTQIITHPETEPDKVTKKRKERRSESTAQCYFELHVRSHYLIEDIVWGDRFTTNFDFRRYAGEASWEVRHRGEGANKLTTFPVKEDDDPEQVLNEVSSAIEANFSEYAPKARRKLERKKRR